MFTLQIQSIDDNHSHETAPTFLEHEKNKFEKEVNQHLDENKKFNIQYMLISQ